MQVLTLARKEAERFHHNFVGTEHLLLGIIALGQGTAVNVLQRMGLNLETLRLEVEKQLGLGPNQILMGNIPYTPRVKKALALAAKESRARNHTYVGTEDILLGLLHEGDGVAARVLQNLGVEIVQTRQEILRELDPNYSPVTGETKPQAANEAVPNSPASETPQAGGPPMAHGDAIDTSRRYDVYCAERNQAVVVYRNALFKGTKKIFPGQSYVSVAEFIELEQADGRTVYVARLSVIKFCEHGTTPGGESVSGQQP